MMRFANIGFLLLQALGYLAGLSPALASNPQVSFVLSSDADDDACVVLLSAVDHWKAREIPCGAWIDRPVGETVVVVVGDGVMSSSSVVVPGRAAGQPPREQVVVRTGPVGRVRLSTKGLKSDAVVRLLQVSESGLAVRREVSIEQASTGVAMPTGTVVALAWSPARNRYLAVSQPFPVRKGQVSEAAISRVNGPAVLVFARAEIDAIDDLAGFPSQLASDTGETVGPAAQTLAADGLWALWLGLEVEEARIEGDSAMAYLVPQSTTVSREAVTLIETSVRRKPAVDVEISLPAALRETALSLEIQRMPGWIPYDTTALLPTAEGQRLAGLPPDMLMLTLHAPPWLFRERVDLRDGFDRFILFAPEPIHLNGTVFRGDQGTLATIDFNVNLRADKGQVRAKTDEEGHYEATLFRPGTYVVEVRSQEATGEPMRDLLELPDRRYVEHDFRLHDGRVSVEVVDQMTGEPIEGASVDFFNESEDGTASSMAVETSAGGMAISGELRPGQVTVSVGAKTYRTFRGQPLALDADVAPSVVVRLEPLGDNETVDVALEDGRPAAGAELIVLGSLENGVPLWSGTTDHAGRSQVPSDFGGRVLLVRHAEGASAIRSLPQPDEEALSRILLLAPAPALNLQIADRYGQPVQRAGVVLWIDGHRMQGAALGWLTRSRPRADGSGLWRGTGLPRSSVRAVAFAPTAAAGGLAGVWEGAAQTINFPWRERITLTPVAE